MLKQALVQNGLVAILRGLRPEEAPVIGDVLYTAGFRVIEVPLNSPQPYDSIRLLRQRLPADCLIGAGTVLTPEQVRQVKEAGGQVIVMPHSDPEVLRAAKAEGLLLSPGVATPTEALSALSAGADGLKLFPFEALGVPALKAWRAVLPKDASLIPVGGITPGSIAELSAAGAAGVGIGSALYKAGMSRDEVTNRAKEFVAARAAL